MVRIDDGISLKFVALLFVKYGEISHQQSPSPSKMEDGRDRRRQPEPWRSVSGRVLSIISTDGCAIIQLSWCITCALSRLVGGASKGFKLVTRVPQLINDDGEND